MAAGATFANRSPRTVTTYLAGVNSFLSWCDRTGTPPELTKRNVQGWVAGMLEGGAQPSTATTWLGALKRFSAWLAEEGEIPSDPLPSVKSPKLDRKITHALTDDQLKALLATCSGKTLRDRRDAAIIRLLAETGMRASEVVDLQIADVDLTRGLLTVRRGKGGKGRFAPFSAQVATALDRYIRMRRQHVSPDTTQLFVGGHIKTFSYWALAQTLRRRARDAGVEGFHVHLMRHTIRHYQSAWEDRAANHNLPLWARIMCLACGRHQAIGHATFGRGELTWILGTPPQDGKPFQKASRQAVHKAIAVAVKYGFLDEDSGMECLVVPGHAIAGPLGNPKAPCAVHERKYRVRRAKLGLVS